MKSKQKNKKLFERTCVSFVQDNAMKCHVVNEELVGGSNRLSSFLSLLLFLHVQLVLFEVEHEGLIRGNQNIKLLVLESAELLLSCRSAVKGDFQDIPILVDELSQLHFPITHDRYRADNESTSRSLDLTGRFLVRVLLLAIPALGRVPHNQPDGLESLSEPHVCEQTRKQK